MKSILDPILKTRFPRVEYACGYGSGVFKQGSVSIASGKMVDTIFVVKNSRAWHEENRDRNPTDYPFVPRYVMSAASIEHIQRHYGGSMWFNTLIPCKREDGTSLLMKYGVIEVDDMVEDCEKWSRLYIAGRLQKPVLQLGNAASQDTMSLSHAILHNRQNALKAALALLSGQNDLSKSRVLEEIVGISYGGDVRVGLAESPTKVKDIAKGSMVELDSLYFGSDLSQDLVQLNDGSVQSLQTFKDLIRDLPEPFRSSSNAAELRAHLAKTVRTSSFAQTAKGFLTAGLRRSISYGSSKVAKRFGS